MDNKNAEPSVEQSYNYLKASLSKYTKDGESFDQIVEQLEAIRKTVISKEEAFYFKLGVNDYEGLTKKINAIETKYDDMLPNGRIITEIKNRFDFIKNIKHATNQELKDAVEYVVNDFLGDQFINNQQEFDAVLGAGLNNKTYVGREKALDTYLQKKLRTDKNGRFIVSRSGDRVGLGKIIVGYNNKTNEVIVTTEDFNISSGFRKKLEEDLLKLQLQKDKDSNKISVFQDGYTKEDYRRDVDIIIHKFLSKPDDVKNPFGNKNPFSNIVKLNYDLNRSIASTIGYLGELRATLILQELCPDMPLKATGNLRDDITKREIPIDIVCAANGFQIKNYSLDGSNTVTFSNTLSSVSWIKDRMQLSGEIGDMLITLFGIYQYNQPINPREQKNGKMHPPPRLDEYRQLYSDIGDLIYELGDLYDSRIPQMIKIQDAFSVGGDPMFHSKRLYFNTFFWINKHLVPASWILEKIIDGLKKSSEDSGASDAIKSLYHFSTKADKQRYAQLGTLHRSQGLSYDDAFMAKKVKAHYEISINLSEFFNFG